MTAKPDYHSFEQDGIDMEEPKKDKPGFWLVFWTIVAGVIVLSYILALVLAAWSMID